MAATGWKRAFDEPIPLPDGKKLITLRDAIAWLAKEVPKIRARDETSSSRRALRH